MAEAAPALSLEQALQQVFALHTGDGLACDEPAVQAQASPISIGNGADTMMADFGL